VPLSPDVEAVVTHARRVVEPVLDDLRGHLLASTGDVDVESKDDGTPVTDADLEADERLAEAIGAAFPTHGVLSEERETVAPDVEWCWVIDPIDGTSNFVSGLPWWCVSVALAHRGEPVLGLVDAPALGARWSAELGRGAFLNGRRLRVRPPVDWRDRRLRHVPLMLTTGTASRARAAGVRLNPRVMGSTALDICTVAQGVAAGSVAMIPHVWDVAAAGLLVTEAGGVVATLRGDPLVPMSPGVDQRDRSAVTVTGPTEEWLREVCPPLLP
jgi:myo-inositol-1(or 4)-monophosphatase